MIARVPGEAFDADQITQRCEDCGLSEYSCECEVEEWPAPTMTMAEVEAQIARAFGTQLVEVEHLGPGRIAA